MFHELLWSFLNYKHCMTTFHLSGPNLTLTSGSQSQVEIKWKMYYFISHLWSYGALTEQYVPPLKKFKIFVIWQLFSKVNQPVSKVISRHPPINQSSTLRAIRTVQAESTGSLGGDCKINNWNNIIIRSVFMETICSGGFFFTQMFCSCSVWTLCELRGLLINRWFYLFLN